MLFTSKKVLLSFKDPKVFESMSSFELIRSYALFTAFSFNPLIRHSFRLHQAVPRLFQFLARPAFSQFCAGASEVDVAPRLAHLRHKGVGAILDYAAESSSDLDKNVPILQRAISAVSGSNDRVAVKLTALASVEDLERFSAFLLEHPAWLVDLPTDAFPPYIQPSIRRIEQVIHHAHNKQVQVYIDAEWLTIQPAIEYITLCLMKKFNTTHPIVSNTYQCYLQRTLAVVHRDLALAKRHKFVLGAKVVRGAYMTTERERARSLGVSDPVCADYYTTSANYHKVLGVLVKEAVVGHVLVATHNPDSINVALQHALTEEGKVNYAQLLGMADNVTYGLAGAGKPVFKYVPYGPMQEVMPYLLRRAIENSALMGSVHVKNERDMVKRELTKRFFK